MTGTVFDIKEFSVHDGPGVRTTVFLKGCPLSCKWCHNPEGLSPKPELMVRTARCKHCGRCMKPCNHPECQPFHRCIKACPDGLISICGKEWEASDLAGKLLKNADFFKSSGGGITVSGGEPSMQADFAAELLSLIGKAGVHRCIETCGFTSGGKFEKLLDNLDFVMMDIKLADPELHKKWCGVDNKPILENFRRLKESGKPHLIRVPLIPDITDTRENLAAIAEIVGDSEVELLGYNSFAGAKYEGVGRVYTLPDKKNNEIDLSLFRHAKLSK